MAPRIRCHRDPQRGRLDLLGHPASLRLTTHNPYVLLPLPPLFQPLTFSSKDPIHLHGHDFFVLGHQSSSFFDSSTMTSQLNFANPPRRDTATLPANGWLVLAFPANNPGAWLMHCHIAWHISEGLGVQFLEAKNSISLPDQGQFDQQCQSWSEYSTHMAFPQIDSGL
jgi:hypothetical protein